jgi:RNA polymerase sigma factor (sigma-70 family)
MSTVRLNTVIQHLRQRTHFSADSETADGQLLESFVNRKDEGAFAALLRRHGPMVLGVCRRVTGNHHDAEDACQAAFLVLASKASSICPREMVANWLHGVAYRTALRARALAVNRHRRERQVAKMPETQANSRDSWDDLQPLLDRELDRLPEMYRLAILLCDVEGKSIKQAARQLGWPQGTMAGRLARARRMLAKRLSRRGIGLTSGSLAVVLAEHAAAAMPASFVSATLKAAGLVAAGQTVAGAVPVKVAALTKAVVLSMTLMKWKSVLLVAALVLCLCGVGGLSLGLGQQGQASAKPGEQEHIAGKQASPDSVGDLIKQLGDGSFTKRELASKKLEALGDKALDALRAAKAHDDPEIRGRAAKLVASIEAQLERTDVQSVPPPKGAIVLFDGKNLDNWVGREGKTAPTWRLLSNGVMEAQGADIQTWKTFSGGYKLHVEFRVPHMPHATGQARGNSGVYLQGRYEVQILDSYGLPPSKYDCGAIWDVAAPKVNACKAPEIWQSYDIEFHPAEFKNGAKVKNARVTVIHNGILIHDNSDIPVDTTGHLGLPGDSSQPGPVLLQYHSSPVQFRNVWLMPLPKH